jgi:hypothetical protein
MHTALLHEILLQSFESQHPFENGAEQLQPSQIIIGNITRNKTSSKMYITQLCENRCERSVIFEDELEEFIVSVFL